MQIHYYKQFLYCLFFVALNFSKRFKYIGNLFPNVYMYTDHTYPVMYFKRINIFLYFILLTIIYDVYKERKPNQIGSLRA